MILDQIITRRKKDIEELKALTSISSFERQIEKHTYADNSFKASLKGSGVSIIAEAKKASPSKGLICTDFDYIQIAKDYERGGAAAISVLTEPNYFLGANEYLTKIKEIVKLPLLRKDFIVDEWQIYEAKVIGADAVLLIAAALTQKEMAYFLKVAHSLGLECLVEAHDEEEVKRSLDVNAEIIGVNNRNLKTFEVSLETSERLRKLIPQDKVFVSESGIHTKEDIKRLKQLGTDAVLIGESIVKSSDRIGKLKELKEA
ncbi:MAG: trpC [Clostridia bacterium]|jgi:indole-3-glycerol phosphate synthase|nr:trpC [Clostridia bacterium]